MESRCEPTMADNSKIVASDFRRSALEETLIRAVSKSHDRGIRARFNSSPTMTRPGQRAGCFGDDLFHSEERELFSWFPKRLVITLVSAGCAHLSLLRKLPRGKQRDVAEFLAVLEKPRWIIGFRIRIRVYFRNFFRVTPGIGARFEEATIENWKRETQGCITWKEISKIKPTWFIINNLLTF